MTLVGPRVLAIALGYEDLNDHDTLRYDPMIAALGGSSRALGGLRAGRRQIDVESSTARLKLR